MNYILHLAKKDFKFSAAHFTIFSKSKAERLHGHNYYVECDLEVNKPKNGISIDFNEIKMKLRKICEELDEFVLIPKNSSFLEIKSDSKQVHVKYHNKDYSFPKEDVKILPLENITSEELSKYIAESLKKALGNIKSLSIYVEETFGQGVKYTL